MITPVIINRLQWKAYLIFMCTNFSFVPLVYFCYPETANLTLEEIDYLYTKPGVSARHVAAALHKDRAMAPREEAEDPEKLGSFAVERVEHSDVTSTLGSF